MRDSLAARYGIPAKAIMLHATHTHGGPQPSTGFAPSLGDCDPRFAALLEERLDRVVGGAADRLLPVDVSVGSSSSQMGVFRRRQVEHRWSMAPDPAVGIDRQVRMARFADRETGRVVAALVTFACHPTTSGETRVSADYPGATSRRLSAALGGAVVMFLQGCAGDIRPNLCEGDVFRLGDERDATRLGHALADRCWEGLQSATPTRPDLAIEAREAILPLACGQSVLLQMTSLRIAEDLRLLGLNAEPVGAYGAYVRARAADTWPLGYTNGMLGYLPSDEQPGQGGYEPYGSVPHFRLPSPFAVEVEAAVRRGIDEILRPALDL